MERLYVHETLQKAMCFNIAIDRAKDGYKSPAGGRGGRERGGQEGLSWGEGRRGRGGGGFSCVKADLGIECDDFAP